MVKWQPVMLLLDERLECDCGALAVFVSLLQPEDKEQKEEKKDMHYKSFCQPCFERAQHEEDDDE